MVFSFEEVQMVDHFIVLGCQAINCVPFEESFKMFFLEFPNFYKVVIDKFVAPVNVCFLSLFADFGDILVDQGFLSFLLGSNALQLVLLFLSRRF